MRDAAAIRPPPHLWDRPRAAGAGRRGAALGLCVLAVAAELWLAPPGRAASGAVEPSLVALLRGMAALKAVTAAGALVLVDWRLRMPAGWPLTLGYAAAAALMAAAPVPIWRVDHLAAAAVAFHAGLLLLLGLGYTDGAIAARVACALRPGRAPWERAEPTMPMTDRRTGRR